MRILLIGSGGREHTIAEALAQSRRTSKLFVAPGNGGIGQVAEKVAIPADDITALRDFAVSNQIDLTFVGPEMPLSLGIVDLFREKNLTIVGPTAKQARLESSKGFAKQFFRENGIPTAEFSECNSLEEAYGVIERWSCPIVIKADGLAAGKGVIIATTRDDARKAIQQMMEAKAFGDAGRKVVIEEYLEGEEASFMVFADGTDFRPMVVSQDHKRRYDGDAGPNTGGMGAYSVDSILTAENRARVIDSIIRPTLTATTEYSGVLYAGLMMTAGGPKIIEYNCRFGDPETQVVLPRLRTDFVDVLLAIAEHRVGELSLEWRREASASVAVVAAGYPGKVENGKRISGLDDASRMDGVKIYHAGTVCEDGRYYTAGGRVLNVTALAGTLDQALERAYAAVEMISFEGKDYRRDIGLKGLAKV